MRSGVVAEGEARACDSRRAVIVGHAINQDGRSNGLTAPNGPSQVKLIREALAGAGVKGRDVEMLEAHGTGTSLGDPIEVQAVSEALGREREGRRLVMGSAKTNFGHTETAAGVLGVLKAVLCMERETVAQHLHLRQLNEYIGTGVMEGMGCVVPVESVEWKSETKRAGVSSFGFSGTNAHVVVEESKKLRREEKGEEKDGGVVVVRVSGKSEAAMQSLARAYSEWMAEGEGSAAAFGRATVAGRMVMKHVQRVVGATRREMARLLVAGESNASEGDEETARVRAVEGDEDGDASSDVPTYAFERKEYWAEAEGALSSSFLSSGDVGAVGGERFVIDEERVAYQVDVKRSGWYAEEDHVVYGEAVMPGAAHVCAVVEQSMGEWGWEKRGVEVSEVEIREAVVTSEGEQCVVQYVHGEGGWWEARQHSKAGGGGWKVHARGRCREAKEEGEEAEWEMTGEERAVLEVEGKAVGGELWDELKGIRFGGSFRWIKKTSGTAERQRMELEAPVGWRASRLHVPVELLDSLFQASMLVTAKSGKFMAPFAVARVVARGRLEKGARVEAEARLESSRQDERGGERGGAEQ